MLLNAGVEPLGPSEAHLPKAPEAKAAVAKAAAKAKAIPKAALTAYGVAFRDI